MAGTLARDTPGLPPHRPRAVLIDVGFTLTAFDGARIAQLAADRGVIVTGAAIEATEPTIRRDMMKAAWAFSPQGEGADRAIQFYRRMLLLATGGEQVERVPGAAEYVWANHLRDNLWTRVLPGVPEALQRLRAEGIQMVVVSNSEGNIEATLHALGMGTFFRAVFDSTVVGMAKPDPRIFLLALAAVGCAPAQAMMVGDSLAADVLGAHGVGMPAALLDPLDLHQGAPVPRFSGFAAFVSALCDRQPSGT